MKISKIKKKLLVSFFNLVLITFPLANTNVYSIENKILLKINNEIITTVDILNESDYLKTLNPNIKKLQKNKITQISTNSLIREKIKYFELNKYLNELKVDSKYLDLIIKDTYLKLNLSSYENFIEYLGMNNIDINTVKNKLKIEILWNQLIFTKFSKNLKIDKEKIKYNLQSQKDLKMNKYFLSEILFEVDNIKNLNTKYSIIKKDILEKGFDNSAAIHSISSTSKFGGDLGWIDDKVLNSQIKKEVSKLKLNNYTNPIKVPGGFLILKLKNKKQVVNKFNINKEFEKIIKIKKNQQLNQFANIYFNKIKKDIKIEEL
tara:strand:- start:34 stop:990 length:957 start_codon:yes stop_codon:yes gene_type:complete